MQKKYPWWMLLLGIALMGYGCADRTPTTSQADPALPDPVVKVAKNTGNAAPSPAGTLPKELSPSQDALKRLPQVSTGRSNPFGSILPSSLQVRPRTPEAMSSTSVPVPAPPTMLEPTVPVPGAPIAAVPIPQTSTPPQSQSQAPTVAAAPTVPAPVPAPPPSLASQIRISGIVQIGNQLNVLVEMPNGGGSRPVRVGEDIVSGRVRLARVNVAANREPQIVLEEGGVETIRTVDSGV